MQNLTLSVISCVSPAHDVFHLKVKSHDSARCLELPCAGQFYMLRACSSQALLARPISVFRCNADVAGETAESIEFLILKKGIGTAELCALKTGDTFECIGPSGNGFALPAKESRVVIIGGGIGVAPVAGFAELLSRQGISYDFYACFRSQSYGLAQIKPEKMIITTDDGNEGVKGILSDVFSYKEAALYTHVYACGPEALLRFVQKCCEKALQVGNSQLPHCFISMESRMACGVGACLGCTIRTKEGNRRCCKDGPVFDAYKVLFD